MDLGSKHLVGYFVVADNACHLTVMIAERESDDVAAPASRLQISVEPGKSARVDTQDGATASFACDSAAQAMRVEKADRVASNSTER